MRAYRKHIISFLFALLVVGVFSAVMLVFEEQTSENHPSVGVVPEDTRPLGPWVTMSLGDPGSGEPRVNMPLFDTKQVRREKINQIVALSLQPVNEPVSSADDFSEIRIHVYHERPAVKLNQLTKKDSPVDTNFTSDYSSKFIVYLERNEHGDTAHRVVLTQNMESKAPTRVWMFNDIEQTQAKMAQAISYSLQASEHIFSDLLDI